MTTLLFRFQDVIFRRRYILQKSSSSIETAQGWLYRVLHFNRQNLILISPPSDQAAACGTY